MFKQYLRSLVFLICLSSPLIAAPITRYEIVDIGVLGADESEAIAINDTGHVLGKLKNEGKWEVFLWQKDTGIQILDLPNCWDLHLNNKGQIAGVHSSSLFIWDPATGFYNIGSFDGETSIVKFNDQGQILVRSWNVNDSRTPHIYIWSQGTTKKLSTEFLKSFPNHSNVSATAMNNKGDVILIATCSKDNSSDIENSFIWSENTSGDNFRELFKEYGVNVSVAVKDLDDEGNMIVEISNLPSLYEVSADLFSHHFYFVNPSKVFQAEIVDYNRHVIIRNSAPQIVFCLPSELKKRFDGVLYYKPGAEIRKLMKPDSSYWFQSSRDVRICGQNSLGYVIGECETIYLKQRHAFLAVPYGTKL